MNFSKTARLCICLSANLVLAVHGDTFILKDGTRLDATVLKEDASSYLLEVRVTPGIRDERVVPKENVVRIERERKDRIAYQSVAKLVSAPDFLDAAGYAARIGAVEKFIRDYPASPHIRDARGILVVLEQEAAAVGQGGIKLNGVMLPAAEYRANALEIDAAAQESKIRKLLAEGAHLAALRAFTVFERDFRNTRSHEALVPMVVQAVRAHLAQTARALETHEARVKERETGLQRMRLDDRRRTLAALAEEAAGFEQRLKSEKESKTGWVTTDPFFKPALEETMTFGKQELTRLTAARPAAAGDAGAAFRDALREISQAADAAAAGAALGKARTAMVPERYLAILEAAAAAPR